MIENLNKSEGGVGLEPELTHPNAVQGREFFRRFRVVVCTSRTVGR